MAIRSVLLGMFAAWAACVFDPGLETSEAGLGFTDTVGNPYAAEIEALLGHGITAGCSTTTFCPNDLVTRGQAAIFLVRALNVRAGRARDDFQTGPVTFADVAGHYAARHVQRLYELGITRGTGTSDRGEPLFSPDAQVTQGQMAVFVTRALTGQRFDGEWFPYPSIPMFPGDVPDGHVFFRHVQRQAEQGIWCGCEPGSRFCVDAAVTRAETAAIVERGFFDAPRCTLPAGQPRF